MRFKPLGAWLAGTGQVPAEARPFVYCGRLVAPPKPGSGGSAHRPLGAGVAWRRVAAGYMATALGGDFGERLGPLQLGVGVSRGPEIFAAAVRLALEEHRSEPNWVSIKIDFRNAFNEVSRLSFLRFCAAHFPAVLILFLLAAYGAPAYITALGPDGWVRYLSRRGCTQGCPLGPLCFAAAVQLVLERVQREFPDVLVLSLHDDGQVAGRADRARLALARLVELASAECGLMPVGHKFALYVPALGQLVDGGMADIDALHAQIDALTPQADLAQGRCCRAQADGVVIAGVPIGGEGFVRSYARERLADHERCHRAVRVMADVQVAFLILRYCLGARFMFLLRACGGVLRGFDVAALSPVELHDAQQRDSLAALLVSPTDAGRRRDADWRAQPQAVWSQASLPPSMGGVGLACATSVCECAYLAGVLACLPYIRRHATIMHAPSDLSATSTLPTFAALRVAAGALAVASGQPVDLSTLLSASPPAQRALAEGMWERVRAGVRGAQHDAGARARVWSTGGAYAGSWLDCIPVCAARRAVPSQYRLALAMRLGVVLTEVAEVSALERRCGCGLIHDIYGRHPSLCSRGNRESLWTVRHDALQYAVQAVARAVGRAAHVVGRQASWFSGAALAAVGRARDRPLFADLVLPHYRAPGRHLYVDVAIASPEGMAALRASPPSSERAGVAAGMRVSKKHSKYRPATDAMGSIFRAAVMERYGACSDDLVGLVRCLCGEGEREATADDFAVAPTSRLRYYMQRVVFAGVMADAEMVERALDRDIHGMHPGAGRGGARAARGARGGLGADA